MRGERETPQFPAKAGPTPGWPQDTLAISDELRPSSKMPAMVPTPLLGPPSRAGLFAGETWNNENRDSRVGGQAQPFSSLGFNLKAEEVGVCVSCPRFSCSNLLASQGAAQRPGSVPEGGLFSGPHWATRGPEGPLPASPRHPGQARSRVGGKEAGG